MANIRIASSVHRDHGRSDQVCEQVEECKGFDLGRNIRSEQSPSQLRVLPCSNTLQGIGYAVAEACLENGAIVTVSSSNPERVEQAITKLERAYPSAASRISGCPCNLSDEATLEPNIIALLEQTGPEIDHIVHTAGDPLALKSLAEGDMQSIKQAGMIRFFSYLLLGKHAAKFMKPGPGSSITFTSAGVSERPMPGWSVVNAYLTGQHGICRGLALDLKPVRWAHALTGGK